MKDSGAKVISFYVAHKVEQQAAGFLSMYAVVFFLFFAAGLRGYMRRMNVEMGATAAASLAGAVLLAVGATAFASTTIALADVPDKLDPAAAQALNVLNNDFFVPLIAGTCVFMIANGIAAIRFGVFPVWVGWIAIVIGVVSVTPIGFFGFLAMVAWVIGVSLLLFVRASREPGAAAA